jgi:hypothetical protein
MCAYACLEKPIQRAEYNSILPQLCLLKQHTNRLHCIGFDQVGGAYCSRITLQKRKRDLRQYSESGFDVV